MSTKRGEGTKASSSTSGEGKSGQAPAAKKVQQPEPGSAPWSEPRTSLERISFPHQIKEKKTTIESVSKDDLGHVDPSLGQHPTQEPDREPIAHGVKSATSADSADQPRQVIAVSASKGPAAFFNLARKFLVTDETCDLSALEGAIVSAVDAAHLLERSKLATVIRVHTSYVTVEPKRKKQQPSEAPESSDQPVLSSTPSYAATVAGREGVATSASTLAPGTRPPVHRGSLLLDTDPQRLQKGAKGPQSRELRRARIIITVQRTEGYKQWLEENPLQAIIAGDGDNDSMDQQPEADLSPPVPP